MPSCIAGDLSLALPADSACAQQYLPNPQVTPGALNPYVTQGNLQETACSPGWTSTIRPSSSYIERLKKRQMRELGMTNDPKDYHEDHLAPLCVGGHPSDHRNLWPQPLENKWRDADKNQLEASVCRGAMTLEEGQAIFLRPDWTLEFRHVQTAKPVHWMASGCHKRSEQERARGRTVVVELHRYPASRGRVLRHIGEQLERAAELLVAHRLRGVRGSG